tara:strand:+ start:1009 stop:1374 length:366 start_codon:yes stop_codon:yes gene_type:complete
MQRYDAAKAVIDNGEMHARHATLSATKWKDKLPASGFSPEEHQERTLAHIQKAIDALEEALMIFNDGPWEEEVAVIALHEDPAVAVEAAKEAWRRDAETLNAESDTESERAATSAAVVHHE